MLIIFDDSITTSNQVCMHVFVCMSTYTHAHVLSGNFSCSYYVHLLEITNWQLVCFAKSEIISSSLCDITHEKKQTADAEGLTRLKKHSQISLFELSHSQCTQTLYLIFSNPKIFINMLLCE